MSIGQPSFSLAAFRVHACRCAFPSGLSAAIQGRRNLGALPGLARNPDQTRQPARPRIALRILQTTDLHGTLTGYDYLADRPSETQGLTRTATLIRAARAEARNNLLFDSGDMLQGSAIGDLAAERGLGPGAVHPVIELMNDLGYDAATPGNHDFDFGAEFLMRALADAAFPIVSANFLHRGTKGRPVFAPEAVLVREMRDDTGHTHSLRIGVTGCLPPQTVEWEHHLANEFATSDMVAATRASAARLRAQGCDLVVLLAHTGIDTSAPDTMAENAIIDLAALDDIDIVLGGHTHHAFPMPGAPAHSAIDSAAARIHGKPVLMSGFWGNHLGVADLTLERAQDGRWRPRRATCRLVPLARRDAQGHITETTVQDRAAFALAAPAHQDALRHVREPVGETAVPLHSYFSLIANDASVQLVAGAQADYARSRLAGTRFARLPIVSAAAPFKTGRRGGPEHYTNVSPGPLSRRSIADLYYYPNRICVLRLFAGHLREMLEHSASLFSRLTPGHKGDTPLLRESFPGYKFDVFCGLRYSIDLSQPPRFDGKSAETDPSASRIRNVEIDGKPLEDHDEVLLVTNSYRVHGTGIDRAGRVPGPRPEIVLEEPVMSRDILHDYIRAAGRIDITLRRVWSFLALGGATAIYESAPAARAWLDDPMLPPIEDLGDTPQGFARFRITL